MKRLLFRTLLISFSLLPLGCIEPYPLPDNSIETGFLVVDGFMDAALGKIQVRLTRTKPVNDSGPIDPELNAKIIFESEDGKFAIEVPKSDQNGNYQLSGLTINSNSLYRIRIQIDEKEYASTFVQLINTPQIDSVTWVPYSEGVKFRVSTHLTSDNPGYYMWSYDETWEYRAPKYSAFKMVNDTPVQRMPEETLFTCWQTKPSNQIIVKSTDQLNANLVQNFEVVSIPVNSRKLNIRYSMLLKQISVSKEAYEFWSKLQQTTESVGGLFDPQPGQVLGNISCISNSSETVIGIFSIGSIQEMRISLKAEELPEELVSQMEGPGIYCQVDTVLHADIKNFSETGFILLSEAYRGDSFIGYTYSSKICGDCQLQGGVASKPPFWN